MPYLITTTQDADENNLPPDETPSRRAVATLGEAQRETAQTIADHNGKREGLPAPVAMTPDERGRADDAIGEQGGHYSLPDGTVIEVEQVSWLDFSHRYGHADGGQSALDAYNAREN